MSLSAKTIGVMGGSFNPVHLGHLMVADYVRQHARLDRVMLVLSPQNPLKTGSTELIDDRHRFEMLKIACGAVDGLEASDIELNLPRPSYTVITLRELSRCYPDCRFRLIIGGDNWAIFNRWRAADEIIADYAPIVYPRPGFENPSNGVESSAVQVVEAPLLEISSTFVRRQISEGYDMNIYLPRGVYDYIKEHKLYRP